MARRVFLVAGVYGLLVTAPQLFLEGRTSREFPPAITHPEFYYGFLGAVLAWQVAFLLIGSDPVRYRPLMAVALIEKGVFAAAVPILFVQGRVPAPVLIFAAIDLILAVLFFESWRRLKPSPVVRDDLVEIVPTTDVLVHDLDRAIDAASRN